METDLVKKCDQIKGLGLSLEKKDNEITELKKKFQDYLEETTKQSLKARVICDGLRVELKKKDKEISELKARLSKLNDT